MAEAIHHAAPTVSGGAELQLRVTGCLEAIMSTSSTAAQTLQMQEDLTGPEEWAEDTGGLRLLAAPARRVTADFMLALGWVNE